MDSVEMETLLQAIKRVERKLDIVIRAIYEHDEDIQDDYGRSQRSIEAGRREDTGNGAGGVLGDTNESSLRECNVPDVQREEPRAPIANRSSKREANPPRDHGKVQREEPISRSHGTNQNVPRKDGVREPRASKPNATYRHSKRRGGKGGTNGAVKEPNR